MPSFSNLLGFVASRKKVPTPSQITVPVRKSRAELLSSSSPVEPWGRKLVYSITIGGDLPDDLKRARLSMAYSENLKPSLQLITKVLISTSPLDRIYPT